MSPDRIKQIYPLLRYVGGHNLQPQYEQKSIGQWDSITGTFYNPEEQITQQTEINLQAHFPPELYLSMTEACNFACHGCATHSDVIPSTEAKWLTFEESKTIVLRYLLSCLEKKETHARIKYAGGEPLLYRSFSNIKKMQAVLAEFKQEHPNFQIEQVVITNGVMLGMIPNIIPFLKKQGIYVGVSLWGNEETNDLMRNSRSKNNTYATIRKGLQSLQEHSVPHNISFIVTPENANSLADVCRALWDPRHETYIYKNNPPSLPVGLKIQMFRPQDKDQSDNLLQGGYDKMVDGIRKAFQVILEMHENGIQIPNSFTDFDYLQLNGVVPAPCGSGFRYVAAGSNGIASCHEKIYDSATPLTNLHKNHGNLFDIVNNEAYPDDQRENLIGIRHAFQEGEEFWALHGGSGCPHARKAENDDLTIPSSITANIYSVLLNELLALSLMTQKQIN